MMLGTVVKVLAIALAAGAPLAAGAQAWPAKPVRMLVPFPPGGGVDFAARIVGKHLSDRLGQQVVIENRAGANGIIALEALKGAAPDGYTIAAASNGPLVINPAMYVRLPYDPLRDFVAVGSLVSFPLLLVVHPSVPANSVHEVIALARARPGALTFSSPGVGNGSHLAAELFAAMANVQLVHVPYKGTAPAATALLAGEVALAFSSIPTVLPHVRAGKLRALGVGNATRVPSLPEFPTIAESGVPGYEAFSWAGVIAPTGTPRDVVVRLNREIGQVLRQKDVADQLANEGTIPTPDSPEEFAAYIKSELGKWGAIVQLAKIKPE
ncbi:MAG TPA: tripartite tricarboxylate transporter substrate binding protein [Burkholderiales bacterium]|nr:tripartite tricarboxylate transporter substrate binding protein [Burkholderiales bacterium]